MWDRAVCHYDKARPNELFILEYFVAITRGTRKVPLTNIRGRAAGDSILGGAPEFCGRLSTDGLIRIDSGSHGNPCLCSLLA